MKIPTDFDATAFGLCPPRGLPWKRLVRWLRPERHLVLRRCEALASKLRQIIEPRLLEASDPERELDLVIDELRELGHLLLLDEDDEDWRIYTDLPNRNLAIWTHWDASTPRRVSHVEVLWQKM